MSDGSQVHTSLATLHRTGVPIADLTRVFGVSHTVLYRRLAKVPPNARNPRIIPWSADEDAILIEHQDATAQSLTTVLHGRTYRAIKWRRGVLRRRGDLPPWESRP